MIAWPPSGGSSSSVTRASRSVSHLNSLSKVWVWFRGSGSTDSEHGHDPDQRPRRDPRIEAALPRLGSASTLPDRRRRILRVATRGPGEDPAFRLQAFETTVPVRVA